MRVVVERPSASFAVAIEEVLAALGERDVQRHRLRLSS